MMPARVIGRLLAGPGRPGRADGRTLSSHLRHRFHLEYICSRRGEASWAGEPPPPSAAPRNNKREVDFSRSNFRLIRGILSAAAIGADNYTTKETPNVSFPHP